MNISYQMNDPKRTPLHIALIAVTTIVAILISLYYLSSGSFIVFQNLFYIPIILSCMYYAMGGFVYSVCLAVFYMILILIFTREFNIVIEASTRVVLFIAVAGVVTFLSNRLERATQKLRENVEERERLIEELKIKNNELVTFSYAVSHDLRAPLIVIEGFSRVLIEKHGHNLDIKGQDHLMMIKENAKRMDRMIKDLHDFFRLGRKSIQPVTFDMEKTVNDIMRDFKSMFPDEAFRVELGILPAAQGDQKMVRQALINLIGNAIKYRRPNSTAVIKIGGLTEKDRNIYFVKDHGIGFSMEHANKIFKVFERLHGLGEFEGTGIGLAIVKRIIQMHGGDVWAEGAVNAGATFYFSLPHRESEE